MADGQEAEDSRLRAARDWPYAQRLADRNWKIRRDGYEDAKAACSRGHSPDDSLGECCRSSCCTILSINNPVHSPCMTRLPACRRRAPLQTYAAQGARLSFLYMHAGPLLAKGLGDANAACQDGALEAMLAYLAAGDEAQAAR